MAEGTPTQISLADGSGLFAALRNPSIKLRSAVLRAIEANPQAALRLGKYHDRDVIDELVFQVSQEGSVPYCRLLVKALACYEDPRVDLILHKIALVTRDEELRRLALRDVGAANLGPSAPQNQGDGSLT